MASINLSSLILTQASVLGSKDGEFTCVEVRERYIRDQATKLVTDNIEGYSIDVLTVLGERQTVKLPLSVASTISEIKALLARREKVTVTFGVPTTFKARTYVMKQPDGRILSGVSCSAEQLVIASNEIIELD